MIEDEKEYIQLLHMSMVASLGINKTLEIIAAAQKIGEIAKQITEKSDEQS